MDWRRSRRRDWGKNLLDQLLVFFVAKGRVRGRVGNGGIGTVSGDDVLDGLKSLKSVENRSEGLANVGECVLSSLIPSARNGWRTWAGNY